MVQCKHHQQSSAEGGVCSSCLQKKLKSVRWGETGDSLVALPMNPGSKPAGAPIAKPRTFFDPVHPKEAIAILGSIASIKNRNRRGFHPGRDITQAGLDFVLDSRYVITDGFPAQPTFEIAQSTTTRVVIPMPGLLCPASKTKDRKRWLNSDTKKSVPAKSLALQDSKPLVDRFAKETALRVIREATDEISVEGDGEPEEDDDSDGNHGKAASAGPFFFRPSHLLSKWGLKGIGGSHSMTSSNKVFPSKPSAETTSNRLLLLQAHASPARDQSPMAQTLTTDGPDLLPAGGDRRKGTGETATKAAKEETVIVGMPDRILKPEDMSQRLRTSHNTVLLWLEDLPVPDTLVHQKLGDLDYPEPGYTKETGNSSASRFKQGLAVGGRLHEIAEGHEILDDSESSVEWESESAAAAAAAPATGNSLNEVASFGKFLIRAAQRQPKQGLSRVQARASALTAR